MAFPPLALVAAPLLAALCHAQQDAPLPGGPIDPGLLDGPQLFARACATCHGLDGSGTGPTVLDRPARNFKEGGFSFGNTPEAVFRTLTHGIPGTPMPAWETALSEDQRRVLAQHVLSLGPPQREVSEAETRLVVGGEPVFVRGILPPVDEGARLVPRGLLAGMPDGLTFEYDLDGVRLLAVRAGDFARRTDWGGRGGTPLEPLGRVVWSDAGQASRLDWMAEAPGGGTLTLEARLLATTLAGPRAEVSYALVDPRDGTPVARVTESPAAAAAHGLTGYHRLLRIAPAPGRPALGLRLRLRDAAPGASPVEPGLLAADLFLPLDGRVRWRLVDLGGELFEAVGLSAPQAPPECELLAHRGGDGVSVTLRTAAEALVDLSVLSTSHLADESVRALRTENRR